MFIHLIHMVVLASGTYNMHGFGQGKSYLGDLCNELFIIGKDELCVIKLSKKSPASRTSAVKKSDSDSSQEFTDQTPWFIVAERRRVDGVSSRISTSLYWQSVGRRVNRVRTTDRKFTALFM